MVEDERPVDRRTVLRTAAAGVALTPLVAGTATAHRPDPLDWYQHYVVDATDDGVVIGDENPPEGNEFTMPYDAALGHIRNDHGWHEGEVRQFVAELRKLRLGVDPRWDVLEWYTHQVAGCRATDDGRVVVIEDGLGTPSRSRRGSSCTTSNTTTAGPTPKSKRSSRRWTTPARPERPRSPVSE